MFWQWFWWRWAGVRTIENADFNGCTALEELFVPETVTTIETQAFLNVPHITYHGPAQADPRDAVVKVLFAGISEYISGNTWGAKLRNEDILPE